MKNKSIWLDNITFNKPNKLNQNLDVDVLIIGGGITGLSTAYYMMSSNLKVCVVEKNLIAHAITARTTGKITYFQDNIYAKLKDKSKEYYKSQIDAISLLKNTIKNNNIECDFKEVDSYIYATNEEEIIKIKKEENIFKKIGIKFKTNKKLPINSNAIYSISVPKTYVFHPIKYLIKIKDIVQNNGIPIYENSKIEEIIKKDDGYLCILNKYKIKAKKVIVATHYPFFLLPYFIPIKTSIEKSYISASKINNINNFSAITIGNPFESIRFQRELNNNYLIYLNGSHNICTRYNYNYNFKCLIKELDKYKCSPTYIWSNHDILTEDSLPYIGYIDDNLLIGTGYNTWGMTNGTLAGKILSDLIKNKQNKYSELFNPKRNKSLINIIKYPLNLSYSAKSFIQNKVNKNKKWYKNNVIFTKINNDNVAIYIDSKNNKHIVYNKCPHMGCSLIFNEQEQTWDCPCHGSRFNIDGSSICGPANTNIGYKKNQ